MRRRRFILGLATALAPVRTAGAQQSARIHRVAILNPGRAALSVTPSAFVVRMAELGYSEGLNLSLESRFAEWRLDRLPELARQLVALQPDVIVGVSTLGAA